MTQATETAIRKSILVEAPVERAFEVFTRMIGNWWPLETHSIGLENAETAVIETRPGGRVYEIAHNGQETEWGTVTVWDPPRRVAFTWHPGRGVETAQEVDVRFSAEGGATRVDLEHRGWEKLGDRMAEIVPQYDSGWDEVLGRRYAQAAAG